MYSAVEPRQFPETTERSKNPAGEEGSSAAGNENPGNDSSDHDIDLRDLRENLEASDPEITDSQNSRVDISEVFNNSQIAGVSEDADSSEVPEVPDVSEVPEIPEDPEIPEIPEVIELPEVPGVTEFPEFPEVSGAPKSSENLLDEPFE